MEHNEKIKLSYPKALDSDFYRELASTIKKGYIPLCRGHHSYFHLNQARKYGLDHLIILQIKPRSVEEVTEYIKQLGDRNIAVVDGRLAVDEYKNPFPIARVKLYDFRGTL